MTPGGHYQAAITIEVANQWEEIPDIKGEEPNAS